MQAVSYWGAGGGHSFKRVRKLERVGLGGNGHVAKGTVLGRRR